MVFVLGIIVIFVSIIVGFLGSGGNIIVLVQPLEWLIILGTTFGIFINSTPVTVRKLLWTDIKSTSKVPQYDKVGYLEILTFMFCLFRFSRFKTAVEVENHIEYPHKSIIFKDYPSILNNKTALLFVCDFMRIILLGVKNVHELELLAHERIETYRQEKIDTSSSLLELADTLPALGILAAVLGIIIALGSVDGDAVDIGKNIATALMGTFLGIFLSYCIVQPIGSHIRRVGNMQIQTLECLKKGIVAYAKGMSPSLTVEFARQVIPSDLQPSFNDLEQAMSTVPKFTKQEKPKDDR